MSFSAGTFSINTAGQPVVTGTVISSTIFNALTADLATGLSTCVLKDGTQTLTANIPMAGFKFTGLGAGSATGNSLRYEQLFATTEVNLLGSINSVKTTVASATTPDIWTSTGALIDYTGTATATGFANAAQAGSMRELLCAGAAVFTAGANMLIDGYASGASYTAAAGDVVQVIAVTTSQFRLIPQLASGRATIAVLAGTPVATTSGTSVSITGIPAGVTRIIVALGGVSTNGATNIMLQIGSGSALTSGYVGSVTLSAAGPTITAVQLSTGFLLSGANNSSAIYYGFVELVKYSSVGNSWTCVGTTGRTDAAATNTVSGFNSTLGGALDRVILTTVNGTDAFDAGEFNIIYQ